MAFLHDGGICDVGVTRHRLDDEHVALVLDAVEVFQAAQIDQCSGRSEPLLHRRQQRLAARDELGVFRRPSCLTASATSLARE